MRKIYFLFLSLPFFAFSTYAMHNEEEEYRTQSRENSKKTIEDTNKLKEEEVERERKLLENMKKISTLVSGSRMNSKGELPSTYRRHDKVSGGKVIEIKS